MNKTRSYSLKRLLFVAFLITSVITWGITAFISYREIRREVYDLFDDELAQSARVIQAFVASLLHDGSLYEHWDLDSGVSILEGQFGDYSYEDKVAFQLWMTNEGLILRSKKAPTFPFSDSKQGFSEIDVNDQLWDVFSLQAHDNEGDEIYVIHVAQLRGLREEVKDHISTLVIQQFLVGMPILAIAFWLIVGLSLKPVNRLTRQLKQRKANFLKPLSVDKLPNEIMPLFNALNDLFGRLEHSFVTERRFTADASHELRTPLAGLLTQAQVALKTEDSTMRKRALVQIQNAGFRLSHMVKQLLILSRLEFNSEITDTKPTDINQALQQVLSYLHPFVRKKNIDIKINNSNSQLMMANPELLEILVRNIVHNAIQYSPKGGKININILNDNDAISFCVEDSGPGIPVDQREQVLQRFFRRVETASLTHGSGLGLSIVKQIADLHNVAIDLGESNLGGLKFTLNFPLPVKEKSNTNKKTGKSARKLMAEA